MNDSDDYNLNLKGKILLKEIEVIQKRISDYDKNILLIKGWAVTIWTGFWLFLLQQLNFDPDQIINLNLTLPIMILCSIIGFFWIINALLKYYQTRFLIRDNQIADNLDKNDYLEYYFNNTETIKKPNGLKLYGLQEDKKHMLKLWKCFLLRDVSVFYLLILSINCLVLGFFSNLKILFLIGIALFISAIFLLFTSYHECLFDRFHNCRNK